MKTLKKYLIEFIGTFFLVFVIAMSGNPLAIAAVLIAMVYMGAHVSGAHYNPAVTLAILIRKKIEAKEAFIYMAFQIIGGLLASLVAAFLTGINFAPAPGALSTVSQAVLVELLFTFALASVVLHVATVKATSGNDYYGLAIGLTVLAAAFAGGPISGGAYNPAVAIGPIIADAIAGGHAAGNLIIYLIGPFAGAALAAAFFNFINNKD